MQLKFKNPPINELVMGVYFNEPIAGLRSEHIGLYWATIKEDFPKAEQREPIGGFVALPGEVFPLPRYLFSSEDDTLLIQIQRNAFIFNWRKKDPEYPHFEKLKDKFLSYFFAFKAFIEDDLKCPAFSIGATELQYVNLIQQTDYWTGAQDISNVIPSYSPINLGPAVATRINYNMYSRFDDQVGIGFSVRDVQTAEDPTKFVLVFDIKADGPKDLPFTKLREWLDHAHDATGQCFLNVTSERIQREYWIPTESV